MDKKKYDDDPTYFACKFEEKFHLFEENLIILLLFIKLFFYDKINMDTGPSDVKPIFGKVFLKKQILFYKNILIKFFQIP
jgi:hypothetical protein